MARVRAGLRRLGKDLYELRYAFLGIVMYYVTVHVVFGQFCPMIILLHMPCPGCGMTRALVLALTGHWQQAWGLQPMVYGWILLGVLFLVNRYLLERKPKLLMYLLVVMLLGTIFIYVYRICFGFPAELRM